MYQESQLELANELDPVAEAEVYLAYGKDVPAEEILKEGLQQTPKRVAIHLKLLAIYAKRGDAKSFESIALDVKALTQGVGPDWGQVLEMGLAMDPTNPLYNPAVAQVQQANAPLDPPNNSMLTPETDNLSALGEPNRRSDNPNLNVDHNSPRDATMASLPLPFETPPSPAGTSFELGSTSLNQAPVLPESAFATTERLDATLALAQQFLEIGEKEGALALIDEVMAGGNETLRKRATELLAKAR
jgi:pilus assembly protein FimV